MNGHLDETNQHDDSYVPRNILLTGGAGFIGSHVVIRLVLSYPEYKVFRFPFLLLFRTTGRGTGQARLLCDDQQPFKRPKRIEFQSLLLGEN